MSTFELAARPGHPTSTDLVAYAGIGLGIALAAFAGHPTSTDIAARPATYYREASSTPAFPTQYAGLRYFHGTVKDLCLVAVADAPAGPQWRIDKNGATYAVYLVDTSDGNASQVRIKTAAGVKAARLKT